ETTEAVERSNSGLLGRFGALLYDLLPEDRAQRLRPDRDRRIDDFEVDPGDESVHTLEYPEEVPEDDPTAYQWTEQGGGTPEFGSSGSDFWDQPDRTSQTASFTDAEPMWQPASAADAYAADESAQGGSRE